MADSRDIRRLAFQLLFQIDAADTSGGADAHQLAGGSEDAQRLRPADRARAASLAQDAYNAREGYDNTSLRVAPGWPAHRQPAVDRAIIRLAQHELSVALAPVAVVISEAVELAKEFGTEKSPGFVNAVVDRIAKDRAGEGGAAGGEAGGAAVSAAPLDGPSSGPDDARGEGGVGGGGGAGGAGGGGV